MDAPWYHAVAREDQIAAALEQFFNIHSPLAVFPIQSTFETGHRVQGVLFILKPSQKPSLRLFSQRVLVNENDKSLLGEKLRAFVSGVVDVEKLPIVISRDGVVENATEVARVRECLVHELAKGLGSFASRRREDFHKLMAAQGPLIKAACVEDKVLLGYLQNHLPFRSSMRPAVTLLEYLRQRGDSVVIYADDDSLGASLIPLYNQANVEVLYMTDAVDRVLRENWRVNGHVVEFRRLDVNPPKGPTQSRSGTTEEVEASILEAVRLLFHSVVAEDLAVEVRPLGAEGPPAVLSLSEDDRKKMQFVQAVRNYERAGRLGELPSEVQQMAKSGVLDILNLLADQTLILNQSNAIVRDLFDHLRPHADASTGTMPEVSPARQLCQPKLETGLHRHLDFAPMVARFLHGQALLCSGLPLSSEQMTQISQDQTALISNLLHALNQRPD